MTEDTKAREPRPSKAKKKRDKSLFREYFELIAEVVVFVFFVMTFVVQAFQIPTGSMEPTLLVGDFLLVNKLVHAQTVFPFETKILPHKTIERKDIVVFRYPNDLSKDFVKRVIALEGETLEIRDKSIYINGEPLAEPYKVHSDPEVYSRNGMSGFAMGSQYQLENINRDNFGPLVIPKGQVFAMGDNRDNSSDSRSWGFLPVDNIKGRPWIIYFSYRADKNPHLLTGLRDRIKKLVSFLPKARWGRLMKVVR